MMGDWTFFSNYGHVLVYLAKNREARLRDVASDVGITERAVQKIVRDLQDAGYLTVTKQGRCNRYSINKRKSLRHDLHSSCTVGRLLGVLTGSQRPGAAAAGVDGDVADAPGTPPAGPAAVPRAAAPEAHPKVSRSSPGEPGANEPETKPEDHSDKKPGPVDVRQQGSLF